MSNASKTLRELNEMLLPMGYEFQGVNGNGHYVYRHAETGAVARFSKQNMRTGRLKQNSRNHAERAIRHAQSASQLWIEFLYEKFKIGPRDEKVIEFKNKETVAEFLSRHPGLNISAGLPGIVLMNSPLFERIRPGASNTPAVWKARGPLFGLTMPAEVADDEQEQEGADSGSTAGVLSGVEPLAAGGTGEGDETGVGDEVAGGTVAAADEQGADAGEGSEIGERLVAAAAGEPGFVIPPELADQLREALSGDVMAERDLLRESLATAAESLEIALASVRAAMEMAPTNGGGSRAHRDYNRMGLKLLRRWELLEKGREQLGEFLTADKVYEYLTDKGETLTRGAAGNTLWRLCEVHLLERQGQGVYGWVA